MGKVTQHTLEGLTVGTSYVFAVQAYGDHGKTSDFSNMLPHFVAPPDIARIPTGRIRG